MARTPKRKTGPRARQPARPLRYTRKPGAGSRRQPMSGYGAARRNPGKAAAQGATNFSPEPNRIGRDASVTPQLRGTNYNMKTGQHDPVVYHDFDPVTTSEHFEYGRRGDPGPGRTGYGTSLRDFERQRATHLRRVRGAANRGAYGAGELRRRAR